MTLFEYYLIVALSGNHFNNRGGSPMGHQTDFIILPDDISEKEIFQMREGIEKAFALEKTTSEVVLGKENNIKQLGYLLDVLIVIRDVFAQKADANKIAREWFFQPPNWAKKSRLDMIREGERTLEQLCKQYVHC